MLSSLSDSESSGNELTGKRRFLAIKCQIMATRLSGQGKRPVAVAKQQVMADWNVLLKLIEVSLLKRLQETSNDGILT